MCVCVCVCAAVVSLSRLFPVESNSSQSWRLGEVEAAVPETGGRERELKPSAESGGGLKRTAFIQSLTGRPLWESCVFRGMVTLKRTPCFLSDGFAHSECSDVLS